MTSQWSQRTQALLPLMALSLGAKKGQMDPPPRPSTWNSGVPSLSTTQGTVAPLLSQATLPWPVGTAGQVTPSLHFTSENVPAMTELVADSKSATK